MNEKTRYRADIDGLRAGAVALVIGYHFFPSRFPGGYVGVDIFFVISGFLITQLLLHDLEKSAFSISGFYARRIRRIFPALVVVLAAVLAAGWMFLLPREYQSLGLNAFGGAAFSSNFVLLNETGYFDLSAIQKPLLHLWSLGVEEQFYIVWPLLLFVAFSARLSVLVAAAALLIASFALNIAALGTTAAFYLPLTRAWELMVGGIIAVLFTRPPISAKHLPSLVRTVAKGIASNVRSSHELLALIGFILIVCAVAGLTKGSAFPGWWALLPALGATCIICAEGSWLNRTILSHPIAVLIGLISYPLYLWHWPLLSFLSLADPRPSWITRDALIVVAVVLAWLTYAWIERPIRRGKPQPLKIVGLCLAMLAVGGTGLIVFQSQGFAFRIPENIRDIADLQSATHHDEKEWRPQSCYLVSVQEKLEFAPDCLESRRPLLFLWGDSAAAGLYPGLKELQRSRSFGLAQYTTAGCPPALSLVLREHPRCAENNDDVLAVLTKAHPEIVLLHSDWTPDYGDFMPGLRDLVAKLRRLNVPRIIIMGPPPTWDGGLPNAAYRYYMSTRQMIPVRSNFHVSEDVYDYEQRFRQTVAPLGTEYISAWNALCAADKCVTRVGDNAADLTAFDGFHLTRLGSILMADRIARCLFPDAHEPSQIAPAPGSPDICGHSNDPGALNRQVDKLP